MRGSGLVVACAHVHGRIYDALVGDFQGPLDLTVDEVTDSPRARRREPLL